MSTIVPTPQKLLELVDELERELGNARVSLSAATACAERLEFLTQEAGVTYAQVAVRARAIQEVLPEGHEGVDVEAALADIPKMRDDIESVRGHEEDLAWGLSRGESGTAEEVATLLDSIGDMRVEAARTTP